MIRIGFFSLLRQVQGPHSVLGCTAAPEKIIWLSLLRQKYPSSPPPPQHNLAQTLEDKLKPCARSPIFLWHQDWIFPSSIF